MKFVCLVDNMILGFIMEEYDERVSYIYRRLEKMVIQSICVLTISKAREWMKIDLKVVSPVDNVTSLLKK